MDIEEQSINDKLEDVFKDMDKNLDTLSKFLKYSIGTLVYGTNKENFKKCICTLSPELIKLYINNLKDPIKIDIEKLALTKYSDKDKIISVFDLAEGKISNINLGNKKWGIASHLALSKENSENIIEFIKKTWPDITTKLQKKKGKKL